MPIGAAAAALISAGIGVGGSIIANRQNRKLAEQQAQWNKEQQLAQQKYDQQMWQQANQYNSPQSQMARFAQAGLNPHLIYGKGNPGNAMPLRSPDIKPYNRPQMESVTRGLDVFGQYNQFKNIQAQTDNVEANTKLADVNTAFKELEAVEQAIRNKSTALDLRKRHEIYADEVKAFELKNQEILSNIGRNLADIELKESQQGVNAAQTELLHVTGMKTNQEIENLKSQNEQIKELTKKYGYEAQYLDATMLTRIEKAEKDLIGAMVGNDLKAREAARKELENKLNAMGLHAKDHWLLKMYAMLVGSEGVPGLPTPDTQKVGKNGAGGSW